MSYWTLVLQDGSELPLDGSAGLALRHISGHGMPPITTISSEYALRDGALYQRQKTQPRTVQLLIVVTDAQECGLRASRVRLLAAVNPHRLTLPITLCYYDGKGDRRSLCCYYDGGLDGDWEMPYNTEEIVLRLIAFQPYWSGPAAITDTLDVYDSMGTPNKIIERDANGNWTNLDEGTDGYISVLAVATNGNLYVGGHFDHAGNPALDVNHIALWDGVQPWHALLTGGDAGVNGPVYALAFRQDGGLYIGGDFTARTGGAANSMTYVGLWNAGAWAAVGAAGLNNYIVALAVAVNGDLYAGGVFHDIFGGAAALQHIAMWDISIATWVAVGAGLDDQVHCIVTAPNGDVYAGGNFHTVAGAGITVNHVAKWNGTVWSALGTGVDGIVKSLVIAPNGDLYAGGQFTHASGLDANRVAKWNGVSWSALGNGFDNAVNRLRIGANGDLYAAGAFTGGGGGMGGVPLPPLATWHDGVWVAGWIGVLNDVINDVVVNVTRTVIAGAFTTATVPGVTAIDNIGNARGYPILTITGPGRLLYLINYTTNQVIYFDITLIASEILTIDLSPGVKTVTSSFRGNLISGVLAGALVTLYLAPGLNHIGCYVDNAGAVGSYSYTPMYWGVD